MPRYEFEERTSSKFWHITLRGKEVVVRFGRIGSDGQKKATTFPTGAAAAKAYHRLIAQKIDKGYTITQTDRPKAKSPAKKVAAGGKRAAKGLDLRALYLLTDKTRPVPEKRLDALERELGSGLPAGYRHLMTQVGPGAFLDELVVRGPDELLEATARKQQHRVFAASGTTGSNYDEVMRGIDPASLVSLATSKNGHELVFVKGAPRRVILIPRDQDVLVESRGLGEAFLAFARSGSGFDYPMDKRPFYNTGVDQVRATFRWAKTGGNVDELIATFLEVVPHDHHDGNDPPHYFFFRRLQGMVALQFWGEKIHVWRDEEKAAEWKAIESHLAGAGWRVSKAS
jgi:predicted DNA-binding WGR domain protein